MEITEILYIVLIVSVVVITVTIVWLANEGIGLIKSLKKSADDTAVITKEFKEKVLFVSEALDRVGTAATSVIGMIEDAVEAIKGKRDSIADGLSLVAGVGKMVRGKRKDQDEDEEEPKVEKKVPEKKEAKKEEIIEKPKEEKIVEKPKKEEMPEKDESQDKIEVKSDQKKTEEVEVKAEEGEAVEERPVEAEVKGI